MLVGRGLDRTLAALPYSLRLGGVGQETGTDFGPPPVAPFQTREVTFTGMSNQPAVAVKLSLPDEEAQRTFMINVAGAIRLARDLGPGHTIVTVLCDYGTRYQSRLFNPKFLREKGLPVPAWLDQGQAAAPRVFV